MRSSWPRCAASCPAGPPAGFITRSPGRCGTRWPTGAGVKHAGLNPAENTSATLAGATRISRRGRPGLRTAAWRAVWAGMRHNRVLRARYAHLTGRAGGNRLSDGQARAASAAALLRWLYAVVTRRQAWDARIAAGTIPAAAVTAPAAA